MRLTLQQCRDRLAAARHAVLATVTPDGRPHAVPIMFALAEGNLVTAVDGKPKTSTDLQRLRNIAARPRVAVLAERYDEDWSRLWWVRVDAVAEVVPAGREDAAAGLALLAGRYPQYGGVPPAGPLIVCRTLVWTGWAAAPTGGPDDGMSPGGWAGRVGRATG